MRDELFDRDYQAAREDLNNGLDRLITRIVRGTAVTFDAIHRVEWSAPWKSHAKRDKAGLA